VTPDLFEIVYQGSLNDFTNAADVIVLRERQATPPGRPGDKWSKAYAFADGHSELHLEPDGNFDAWEQQRMIPPK
jgi:hypothetical protein